MSVSYSFLRQGRFVALLPVMIAIAVVLLLLVKRNKEHGDTGNTVSLAPETVLASADVTLGSPEVQALRQQWQAQPDNAGIAVALARLYIEQAQSSMDERLWGYAQATLQPWWNRNDITDDLLFLRATILQHAHDFARAESDLTRLIARNPRHVQARMTRMVVLNIQGRFAAAKKECHALALLAPPLTTASCLAHTLQLTQPAKALEILQRVLAAESSTADPTSLTWAHTLAAEIASREKKYPLAHEHFKAALLLAPRDQYLLGAYADHLSAQNKWHDVIPLLSSYSNKTGLLLRLAVAEKALKMQVWKTHMQQLRVEFQNEHQRGNMHWREYAIFQLRLLENPFAAAEAAKRNWDMQREAIDMKLLMDACHAAGDTDCLGMVKQWRSGHPII